MVRVKAGDPPTETWTPETVDLLKKLYPRDSGDEITLDHPELIQAAQYFLDAKAALATCEAQKAEYEGKLKSAIGGASKAIVPGFGAISWKATRDGKTFDESAFASAHPDLYAQFQKPKPGHRVFRVTPTKEITCKT